LTQINEYDLGAIKLTDYFTPNDKKIMKKLLLFTAVFTFISLKTIVAQEVVSVAHFDKVTVSPHIQVVFTKGDQESVTIQSNSVSRDKVHIESKGNILRVYLEGAKEFTKKGKSEEGDRVVSKPLYNGTVLTIAISYKTLATLSVRGEETIKLKSKLDQDNFELIVYGESKIYIDDVQLKKMRTTIYGESYLELKAGNVTEQKFTAYGESKVDALAINSKVARATLYGESKLNLNVSDQINVTAFGEAKVAYKGNPTIKKGITMGKPKIYKID